MVVVPAATPVIVPVEPIVATEVFPEVQTPPDVLLDAIVVVPSHNGTVPGMVVGDKLFTVTV